MIIDHLKTNHLENPLGFYLDTPVLSWVVSESTGKMQKWARVEVSEREDFSRLVWDSTKREDLDSLGVVPDMELRPCTRYFWRVTVSADNMDTASSETAWFETGKMQETWEGKWIEAPFEASVHPLFQKNFRLEGKVKRARLYMTGLGVYELYVNGRKAGDEYLAPFYNDYNNWVQYQTYDLTDHLNQGDNAIGIMLGNGWYMGRFGFVPELDRLYGGRMKLLCELHIETQEGTEYRIGSNTDWLCHPSAVSQSSIYDGEVYDSSREVSAFACADCDMGEFRQAVLSEEPAGRVMERLSVPLTIRDKRKPATLIHTPAGEQVLDFGQVMTGWVEADCEIAAGRSLCFRYGELLQKGNFYNENLRTAKQEYRYISDGRAAHVRPHFTFYGFRYVLVTGMDEVDPEKFTACVMYSQLEQTGTIETSNPKVNRLFANALWGQKGNFVDVPTDCPQRDERMGWTGDAQVFAATASFNMDTSAFYRKFMYDMLLEQRQQHGAVPHVVPDILGQIQRMNEQEGDLPNASCAWADAAAVIPWTMYLFYADTRLLAQQYENMRSWTEYVLGQDEQDGGARLWRTGFHFADWLALDNPDKESSFGGTDCYYVASCYYYYSVTLTAKAASVLGYDQDAEKYANLANEIRQAVIHEYFTPSGRLAVDTQTGMVLALYLDLVPGQFRERIIKDLKKKLESNKLHLNTGFVGTPYLCPVLSQNGLNEYAYTLLLNEDFPSWLYEINMGATTIWERWNSVLPNGMVSDTGMNSMNHYAYGSIVEWMYRYMCGINPVEASPGFRRAVIAPRTDSRFAYARAVYQSAAGEYISGWKLHGDGSVEYEIKIPFGASAEFVLETPAAQAWIDAEESIELTEHGCMELSAGTYRIKITK